ncbi:MAG: hypothetical protein COT73_04295, partial [Bdellovibrio sp. CG10_big_fil_rev_8_21_14_0_10_47_8]
MPEARQRSPSWIQIRKDLYEQVQNHVQALLGPSSAGLSKYQYQYDREFKKPWKAVSRDHLIGALAKKRFVFIGDFHALQQSQKAELRVLSALPSAEKILLCIEFVEARHQKHLDRYLQGKMTERDFLKSVEWKKNWGFPWDNYRPLLKWAQKKKVRVFGINLKVRLRNSKTLHDRDCFAAQKIAEIHQRFPSHQKVIIYGDLHLASAHLPQQLKKKMASKGFENEAIFLYQNSERIYFQMLERELEHQVDIVRLAANKYCLQSVPPWVKWQNYLLYLEELYGRSYDDGFDDELDLTDYVAKYIQVISEDLGIPSRVDHFSISSPNDRDFWQQVEAQLEGAELKAVRSWIEDSRSFYIPALSIGYLARNSVNSAAQLATAIVFSGLAAQRAVPSRFPQDFLRLIWLESVQYFGSKLINPKRKSDTLADLKLQLSTRGLVSDGKEALQLA